MLVSTLYKNKKSNRNLFVVLKKTILFDIIIDRVFAVQ